MKEDKNFYYRILNINQSNDINHLIEIKQTVLNNKLNIMNNNLGTGLCKIIANNISLDLKDRKISNIILNTKDFFSDYEHVFVIAYYLDNEEIKYILIDPTFNQFVKKDSHILLNKLSAWPSDVLNNSKQGIEVLSHLKTNGYMLVKNEHINAYLNSFCKEPALIDFDLVNDLIKIKLTR